MSLIKSNGGGLGGSGSPGGSLGSFYSHTIDQSLRFNDDDDANLKRDIASSGNRKTWTWSAWVKRGNLGSDQYLFTDGKSSSLSSFNFDTNDKLYVQLRAGGASKYKLTNQVFRDVSAWYHFVWRVDTTQATAEDRSRVYVNGTQITSWSTEQNVSQDTDSTINESGNDHLIGGYSSGTSRNFDGYMAEVNFIDGTSYGPDTFGETKDGVWVPKAVSGVSYGTNGFHLTFADSNYIGRDKSGSKTLVTSPSFSTFGGGDTNFSSTEYAKAADNDLSTTCDRTGSGGIIEFTPSSAVTPTSHTMINAASSGYTAASRPNSVLLQGSNDNGGSWTTIDDLTNGSGANTITTSSFSNSTSYAKLRLNISENHGGSNTRFGQYLVFASDNNGDGENVFFRTGLESTDVVPDSPTNNFATMNLLMIGDARVHSSAAYSEGNLKVAGGGFSTSSIGGGYSTIAIPKDKKIYIEVCETGIDGNYWSAGILIDNHVQNSTQVSGDGAISAYNRQVYVNGVETDYGSSAGLGGLGVTRMAAGDVLGVAVDGATGKVWFHRNGTYFKSPSTNDSGTTGNPSAGTNEIGTVNNTASNNPSGEIFFFIGNHGGSDNCIVNFGQDSTFAGSKSAGSETDSNGDGLFQYAVPTDYVCLHSGNMSDVTIGPTQSSQADDHFDTVLYTGNGSSSKRTDITYNSLVPDWVWVKQRSSTQDHALHDTVRGSNKKLEANTTDDEVSGSGFGTDGLGGASNNGTTELRIFTADAQYNANSATYVAWGWKAGGSASSNSDGSITSSVSANTTSGFSIVSYTGNATDGATVGHGLSQTAEVVLVKRRDDTAHWQYLHKNLASGKVLLLSSSNGEDPYSGFSGGGIDNLASTTFSLEDGSSNGNNVNASGGTYIAYCFHSVEGYSKVGNFIGNSSSDGTFVYLGFRPAWVLIKSTSSGTSWCIFDNKREGYNVDNDLMRVAAASEQTDDDVDFVSNGLKFRRSSTNFNNSSHTYVYLAFADDPFKFANGR